MSPLSIRNLILRALRLAEPYALPFEQLLAECNLQARPGLEVEQLTEHLNWLKEIRYVDFMADPMDPKNVTARKWLITEAGLVALRK